MTKIFTIGHSTVTPKAFVKKLHDFKIDILIDVRTKPYSSRVKHFNREAFSEWLNQNGIEYLYRGKNLGGLEENINFSETIDELLNLIKDKNITLMCSEGDYKKCHRYQILTPEFERKGIIVEHIEWNKRVGELQQKLFMD